MRPLIAVDVDGIRRHGPKPRAYETKACASCGEQFGPKKDSRGKSRWERWERQDTCSKPCSDATRVTWTVQPNGYLARRTKGVLVLQHRELMEAHIGRALLPSEVVHHIDCNRLNNSLDNLLLLGSHSEHMRLHAEMRRTAA